MQYSLIIPEQAHNWLQKIISIHCARNEYNDISLKLRYEEGFAYYCYNEDFKNKFEYNIYFYFRNNGMNDVAFKKMECKYNLKELKDYIQSPVTHYIYRKENR